MSYCTALRYAQREVYGSGYVVDTMEGGGGEGVRGGGEDGMRRMGRMEGGGRSVEGWGAVVNLCDAVEGCFQWEIENGDLKDC